MRIGAGVAVIVALLICGCGFQIPNLPPPADPPTPTSENHMPNEAEGFAASPTDESDNPPLNETAQRPDNDKPRQPTTKSVQLLSPKWAKEAAPQKEEWEKRLDQTVNSVCRGC